MKTTLIAITGLSPAVLSETVWELAQPETGQVIPDTIIVLTTIEGRERMRQQLFGHDHLWNTLRAQILGPNHPSDKRLDFDQTPDRLKVFTRRTATGREEMNDMNRLEDSEAVGDCLIRELWGIAGQPDTRILASISGGFKTMSALMLATMTLVARPTDRILHVLANEPFDGNTEPLFHWPRQPCQELKSIRSTITFPFPKGTVRRAEDAKLTLGEIQFPALRKLFDDYGYKHPPTYSDLVQHCQSAIDERTQPVIEKLVLQVSKRTVTVNGTVIKLGVVDALLMEFLALDAMSGQVHDSTLDVGTHYHKFIGTKLSTAPLPLNYGALKKHETALYENTENRYRGTLNALRKKIGGDDLTQKKRSVRTALVDALPRDERHTMGVAPDRITIES